MVRLLRRQHAGRLVEDQGLGAAVERLENLDALLQADGQAADDGIDVDLQGVFLLEALQLVAGLGHALGQQGPALGAEHHVLQHGERIDQHEVLVHHADAGGDGVVGAVDRGLGAVDEDVPPNRAW